MQYRSGSNRHEPLYDDKRSRAWVFILRNADSVKLPEAFLPHTNFVAWDASPGPVRWTLRGYCQWANPRNYHTLKTRYSKDAEWIPKDLDDKRVFEEHTTRPIPKSSYRYIHGVPYGHYPPKTTIPLHKVGMDITVPDLIQDYKDLLYLREVENEPQEEEPTYAPDDGLVTDDGIYWFDPLLQEIFDQQKRDRDSAGYHEFDLGAPPLKKYRQHTFFLGEK